MVLMVSVTHATELLPQKNFLAIFADTKLSKTPFRETPWLTGRHVTPSVTLFFIITVLLTGHHAMPVLRILKQRLLLSDLFYLTLLPAGFKAQPQFNLKVSRTSHWSSKHSPARLFVWITTIHKRITLVSLYLSVMAGRPTKNVPLTGFELFSQQVAMSTASCFILLATETYNLHWIKVLVFAF